MRRWFVGGTHTMWATVVIVSGLATSLLAFVAARGSWYTDDIDFLVQGSRGFGIDDLLTPVNDHIAPGLRLTYAFFATVAPLNYGFTVAFRAVLWLVACLLMAALLQRLFVRPMVTVIGTGFYALAPIAAPSFMSLSSAVNNLPAHVAGLVLLHCTLDWFQRRSRLALLGGAIAVFGSLIFWEKSALVVVTASALVLSRFGLRRQIGATLAWVSSCVVPLVAFAVLYLSRHQGGSGSLPDARALADLTLKSLSRTILPAVVGGPWQWSPTNPPYFGFASPPIALAVIGSIVVGLAILVCARTAPRELWWWAAVLVYVVATVVLVSYGRFSAFGEAFTAHYHYWSDAAIPLTLAVCATIASPGLQRILDARHRRRAGALLGLLAASSWCLVNGTSLTGFSELWAKNPASAYVATMRSGLSERDHVNLWDTKLPGNIAPLINEHRQVSDLVRLLDTGTRFQDSASQPYILDDHGSVKPAAFQAWSKGDVPPDCGFLIRGAGSVHIPLSTPVPEGDWFVHVAYLSNPASTVTASLTSPSSSVELVGGTAEWPAGLANAYLRATATAEADSVTLSTEDEGTNLCVGSVEVGVPEVAP